MIRSTFTTSTNLSEEEIIWACENLKTPFQLTSKFNGVYRIQNKKHFNLRFDTKIIHRNPTIFEIKILEKERSPFHKIIIKIACLVFIISLITIATWAFIDLLIIKNNPINALFVLIGIIYFSLQISPWVSVFNSFMRKPPVHFDEAEKIASLVKGTTLKEQSITSSPIQKNLLL